MKKLIILLIVCLPVLSGCRTSKNTNSRISVNSNTELTEEKKQHLQVNEAVTAKESSDETVNAWSYIREYYPVLPGDTAAPSLKSETWAGSQKAANIFKETNTDISLSEDSDIVSIEKTRIQSDSVWTEKINADSRPVQGFEWVWVVGCICVAIIIISFIKLKK